jgi:hypothetical protein
VLGIELRTSGSVARNSDCWTTEVVMQQGLEIKINNLTKYAAQ